MTDPKLSMVQGTCLKERRVNKCFTSDSDTLVDEMFQCGRKKTTPHVDTYSKTSHLLENDGKFKHKRQELNSASRKELAVPSTPEDLSLTLLRRHNVNIRWKPPIFDGGLSISNYMIEKTGHGNASYDRETISVNKDTFDFDMHVLSERNLYTFGVRAVNASGESLPATITLNRDQLQVPSIPKALFAEVLERGKLHVSWLPPEHDELCPVTKYKIYKESDITKIMFYEETVELSKETPISDADIRFYPVRDEFTLGLTAVNAIGESKMLKKGFYANKRNGQHVFDRPSKEIGATGISQLSTSSGTFQNHQRAYTNCEHCRQDEEYVRFEECNHKVCLDCLAKVNSATQTEVECPWQNCGKRTKKRRLWQFSDKSAFSYDEQEKFEKQENSKTELVSGNAVVIQGIPNIGLTCYANSIFQVLAQTPGFVEGLRTTVEQLNVEKESSLTWKLYKILSNINTQSAGIALSGDVNDLLTAIFEKDSSFARYEQNDCHSFLMSLFNAMKEELHQITDGRFRHPVEMFEGVMANCFTYSTCNCKEYSDVQMFISLLIPIVTQKESYYYDGYSTRWSVENGIQTLFGAETFENGALLCRKCDKYAATYNQDTMTTKQLEIKKAPEILILQLGRFREVEYYQNKKFLSKAESRVEYPTSLKLEEKEGKQTYQLYAVVLHIGSLHGGHYYSYVKRKDDSSWYRCSDSSVRRMDESSVVSEREAYLLFYRKI